MSESTFFTSHLATFLFHGEVQPITTVVTMPRQRNCQIQLTVNELDHIGARSISYVLLVNAEKIGSK